MYQLLNNIKQFLEGKATEAELNELFMQLNNKEQELYTFWMQNPHADIAQEKKSLPELERNKIKQQIRHKINYSAINQEAKTPFPFLRFAVAAAAIICFIVLGFHFHQKNERSTISQLPAMTQQTTYSITATINTKTILLQDSTLVTLSPGTTLQYDSSYNIQDRKLYLNGIAVFKVKTDASKPLTVYSKHLATTALGTIFEIIETKDSTIVHLVEGSVKVKNYTHPAPTTVFLNSGEKAVSVNAQATLAIIQLSKQKHQRNPTESVSTPVTSKDLAFNQEPLENVLELLTKHYKIPINYNKAHISNIIFTGTFSEDAGIASVLQVIARINNLTIQPDKHGFTIVK